MPVALRVGVRGTRRFLEEGKYAETPLGLSWVISSDSLKSSGAILRLHPNRRETQEIQG